MPTKLSSASRPARTWGRLACTLLIGVLGTSVAVATPYTPRSDAEVLAELPPGAVHSSAAMREQAAARLDAALPLAQFYISQARATGDLRFLGYAEAALAHWRGRAPAIAAVLVLDATILQSRHAFDAALAKLDQALAARPDDSQAWLTRATVLRVLGRYDEARASCGHLGAADPAIEQLCTQSVRGLSGQLRSAYAAILSLPQEALAPSARAWRYSELGEMAVRLEDASSAEHWFVEALRLAPDDMYTRAAFADLLLDERRAPEALKLLSGCGSMEPLLLRIAIAQQQLNDPRLAQTRALLAGTFTVEEQRAEAVHRREQARFLLDVAHEPATALRAALANWRVQREPADVLILLRAAHAAQRPQAAAAAVQFVREHDTEDARFRPYLELAP